MKKLTALLLTGALAISVLTGCGNTTDTKDQAATDAATDATDEATDAQMLPMQKLQMKQLTKQAMQQ